MSAEREPAGGCDQLSILETTWRPRRTDWKHPSDQRAALHSDRRHAQGLQRRQRFGCSRYLATLGGTFASRLGFRRHRKPARSGAAKELCAKSESSIKTGPNDGSGEIAAAGFGTTFNE